MRLLLLLLLPAALASAQDPALDSLRSRSATLPPDSSRVKALNELALNYWRRGNDSLARRTLDQTIALARRVPDPRGEARARLLWARIEADYLSNLSTAYAHLDAAEALARALPDRSLQGQVLVRRAQLFANIMEKVPQSRGLLAQALVLFKQANDRAWEATTYNEMAILSMSEGRYVEAITGWLRARRLQEATHDWQGLRATLPNLGAVYLKMARYDEALACFAAAEAVADRLHDNVVRMFVLGRRGEIMEKKARYAEALALYLRQAQGYQAQGTVGQLPRVYAAIGRMHIFLKNYDAALRYTQRAASLYRAQVEPSHQTLEHAAQINLGRIYLAKKQYARAAAAARVGVAWSENYREMRTERTEYYRQLAEACEHLGRPAQALFYLRRYKAEADTVLNEDALQQATVASMTYDFETRQQAARLHQARQQTRIGALQAENLLRSRNFLGSVLLLSVGAAGYVLWSNRRLRTKNSELARKKAEIEQALYRGQTLERKRVATELHDSVATKVSALKWRFEALDTTQMGDYQREEHALLLAQMGDVYDDIRAISQNLMPEILEKQGLQAALTKLTETLNVQNRTRFSLQIEASGEPVFGKTAYELYPIALELVNNILKHAQAQQAVIALQRQAGGLALVVKDDGQGMPTRTQGDGIGFQNIRARVERLGGSLLVDAPGSGTQVTVLVPERN